MNWSDHQELAAALRYGRANAAYRSRFVEVNAAEVPPAQVQDEVAEVVAALVRPNEEQCHWILRLQDGSFAYVAGRCSYTGWDASCRVEWFPAATLQEARALVPMDDLREMDAA